MKPTRTWPSVAPVIVAVIVVSCGFAFITTEAFSFSIGSYQWIFYVCFAALLVLLSIVTTYHSVLHGAARASLFLIVVGLIAATVKLGLLGKPFDTAYTPSNMGLKNDDQSNVEYQPIEDDVSLLLTEHSDSLFLPQAIDQGSWRT